MKLYPCKTFKITQTKTCQATHPILKALAFNPRYRFHGTNTYTYIFFYSGKPPTGMSTCIFPYSGKPPTGLSTSMPTAVSDTANPTV